MYRSIAIVAVLLACSAGSTSALSCFNCTTFNATNCLLPNETQLIAECSPSPQVSEESCYTRIIGQDVERGCASELTQEERNNCNPENNCQLCVNGENETSCNGELFPRGRLHCHQCTGTTNSTCSEKIQTEATSCLRFLADDRCFVQVRNNSVTRGCLSENPSCNNSRECNVCSGNGCNSRHSEPSELSATKHTVSNKPTNLWCFTCTTFNATNCLLPNERQLAVQCPPSPQVSEVSCYTRIIGQDVERGCASELTQEDRNNCNLVNNCQLCVNGENETSCNGELFPRGRLHCHQCTGTTNSTCSEEIQTDATSCLRFVADDRCFVQVRDNSVTRGCLSENPGCNDSRDCHVCSGNGCNFRHFEHSAAGSLVAQLQVLLGAVLLSAFIANKL